MMCDVPSEEVVLLQESERKYKMTQPGYTHCQTLCLPHKHGQKTSRTSNKMLLHRMLLYKLCNHAISHSIPVPAPLFHPISQSALSGHQAHTVLTGVFSGFATFVAVVFFLQMYLYFCKPLGSPKAINTTPLWPNGAALAT